MTGSCYKYTYTTNHTENLAVSAEGKSQNQIKVTV